MRSVRGGYSLIECLVALAVQAVLLSMCAVTMHSLHRLEQGVRDDTDTSRTLGQLADRLRSDAHGSTAAEIAPAADSSAARLRLTRANGESIDYSFASGALRRVVVRDQRRLHHELFPLSGWQATWSLDSDRDRPLLRLELQSPEEPGGAPWTIQAAVGVAADPRS